MAGLPPTNQNQSMTEVKAKQKNLLFDWKIVSLELDRRHSALKNRIKLFQISDDLITKYRIVISEYAKAKQDIEKRFYDQQYNPPNDALETDKKELIHLLEQEEELAEYARLKDKQNTLNGEWKKILFELDRSHDRLINQLKFCQLSDDLASKHKEILSGYDNAKKDIEKRFNDPQYDPPFDALDCARKEIIHQIDREEEFAEMARLKDKQKTLLDEWKLMITDLDQRHEQTMNRQLPMCNYLKKKHEQLSRGYVQAKQGIERRFENPQYNPSDDALETAKKVLTLHLEQEEDFVDHVQETLG